MRFARHLPVIAGFAALTTFWMWPALRAPSTVIPGGGAGDNLTFVWNTWWMQHALATGQSPLWTPLIFAPWGTSLALHTHAALPSLAGAALLPLAGSAVAATNVVVAVNLLLNFIASYALAFWQTRRRAAAAVAAVVFGCSPYVGAHLQGHFNLVAAWVLPLAALASLLVLERPTWWRVAGAGLAWGTLVYVDYYYAVFAAVMVLTFLAARAFDVGVARPEPSRPARLLLGLVVLLLAIDVAVLAFIAATGGTTIRIGGSTISMHGTDNPAAAAGLLLMLAAAIVLVRRLRVSLRRETAWSDIRRLGVPLAIACVLSAPVLISIAVLWKNGDYSSQRYFWRSAPPGIDLATVVLGNPVGFMTRPSTQRAYADLGIDGVEQSGWLGPAVLVLCAIAVLGCRDRRETRPWLIAGAVFAIWAIGPYLVAAGTHVWMLLPATIVRFVPLVSNARIPSRAMIVVSLAAAMLAAIAWQHLRDRNSRVLAAGLLLLLLADYFPSRPPFFTVDRPSIYDALAAQPAGGTLCELPLGLRDGFGEIGRLDARVLLYQTSHARPMTGGFVARLSPRLAAAYDADPILSSLARLSAGLPLSGGPPLDRQTAGARLLSLGIRYVIVNQDTAPPELLAYVHSHLPLKVVARDGPRTLYAIDIAIA